ncbi:hypothetical protein [Photobacterium damselae]|uniref:hypothetical protein n=1 Tax=Photobacterium damselae TaxID=38293 RepID=UPI001EFD1518|nr:hypothetical protein [Photobacterium damselae]MCG9706501.1 hypothetical protein [Photobacterium damselae]
MRKFNHNHQDRTPVKSVQHHVTQYMLFDLIAHRKHQKAEKTKQVCCSADY